MGDQSMMMAEIMRMALSHRHANTALLGKAGLNLGAKDRGIVSRTGEQAAWTFKTTLMSDVLHLVARGELSRSTLGLAGGYPVALHVARRRDGTCALYFSVIFPGDGTLSEDGERRGVEMRISCRLNDSATETIKHNFLEGDSWESSTCFDHKTPEEMLAQKHLYFPDDDEATLTVMVTFLNERVNNHEYQKARNVDESRYAFEKCPCFRMHLFPLWYGDGDMKSALVNGKRRGRENLN